MYGILNHSITFNTIWFLVTLLSTITLNCFACYLTFKFKYLLIVPLRVYSLFINSLIFYRPDFFLTINPLLANIWSFFLYGIPNCSTTFSTIWFLIILLFTIILNCFVCYLTLKFKYLLIVSLRVCSLFISSFMSYRPDLFLTVNLLLTNIWFFSFL